MSIFTRPFLLAAALAFAAACFVSPASASIPHHKKVTITLNRRTVYFLGSRRVAKDQIEPLLAARVRKNPSVVVVIRCDPHQPFERVSEMVDLVKQSGVQFIMIADPATTSATRHIRPVRRFLRK